MTHLTKQNCFQFHIVLKYEWWKILSQSPIAGRSGMLYFYVSKVLCKNCPFPPPGETYDCTHTHPNTRKESEACKK